MVHIFLSPLPSVSSSTALLLVIVEKNGGESVYPQIIPTLAVPHTRVPKAVGCQVKRGGGIHCSQSYCGKFTRRQMGDPFVRYKNVRSLHCTPETSITPIRPYTN